MDWLLAWLIFNAFIFVWRLTVASVESQTQ